ncbi:LysR family transcriptional regulator [Stenotrophomonas sp. ESTM1D_MKCIP4_1]|uniref:LysR family transcriptional regulator n=1 Tax=Stenotrophomonas sp. ESTM1D_MKCIP4_1 TaxID=2072414 RepID=UPI000D541D77|nr:LysR family transcriptional regulator [Stenotrophomonas sp. ESTM1D_MKCIP4_1]AWH53259.1 LysR family transcriptional regulator [Stenotrophomonas sp. ESTM1D_MKCIP4_1]
MDNTLRRIDLNLLVTLQALLEERNVTRAAERLHLAQPTVSIQLARLRDLFNDPLLLPAARGMRCTARADALREPLAEALDAVRRAVAPVQPFDPANARQTWRIMASDFGESTVVLPALPALRAAAPGTRLAVVSLAPAQMVAQSERGEIDLAIHIASEAPPSLHHRPLFQERYVLAGRRDHPRLKRRPTLKQFCALQHAIVSPDGGGFHGKTDTALAHAGVRRDVVLSVPHFLFLRNALLSTDLVAMMPSRLVAADPALKAVEAPIDVPGFEMVLFWHDRVHRDPAHRWLREHMAAMA